MRCSEAGAAILTADRSELAPGGESPLSAHLRDCEPCRAAAAHVDAATALLACAVARRPPVSDEGPASRWYARRRLVGLAALPIAAAIIGLLVYARNDDVGPRAAPVSRMAAPLSRAVVSVDVARGQTATVLKTRDPNVTIIWLAPGGGL
jgi:predicted anti-sigma-YlaC factor YlaD